MTRKLLILLFSCLALTSCQVKPEPLNFGTDACHACKMTLVDRKFGAEVVTRKGKIYKFDDMGCLIGFCQSGQEPASNISHYLVVNFADPGNLVDAQTAFYVRSETIRSPMASHVAAFLTEEQRDQLQSDQDGMPLTWQDLLGEAR